MKTWPVLVAALMVGGGACAPGEGQSSDLADAMNGCAELAADAAPAAEVLRIHLRVYDDAPERVDACAVDLGLIRARGDEWHDAYPRYALACEDGVAIYEVPTEPIEIWFLDWLPRVVGPVFSVVPDTQVIRLSVRLPRDWAPDGGPAARAARARRGAAVPGRVPALQGPW